MAHATGERSTGGAVGILLVEDDADLATCEELVLREAGYDVTLAPDGGSALDGCVHRPMLILVDFHLAGEPSGEALLRELRRRAGAETRIVVQSGDPEVEASLDDLGADAFLEKPFPIGLLLETVAAELEKERRRRR